LLFHIAKGDITIFRRSIKRANFRSGNFTYARVQILCTVSSKTAKGALLAVFEFSEHRIWTRAYAKLSERKLAPFMPRRDIVILHLSDNTTHLQTHAQDEASCMASISTAKQCLIDKANDYVTSKQVNLNGFKACAHAALVLHVFMLFNYYS
jgi:hypothetical protein